jgi:2-dehydro-3-deoxyglucarate aldolase/4-hydroxy-2-oxoheptanedioate aldolase
MTNQPTFIPTNHAKNILNSGGSVTGTFVVECRQPSIMQMLKNAGFDFVTIDNEHGAFSIETIADLSRTAVWLGLTPIVRIPENSYSHLCQTLDVGAQGLMVPRITHADQVRSIVRMIHYPPEGERGNAMERGLTQFRTGDVARALCDLEKEILLIIQIETRQALENLEEILSVKGVDAVLVGPNDLSISLGYPGHPDHPVVQESIQRIIQVCQAHRVTAGIHMGKIELAVYWASQGMRLVSTGSEVAFIQRAGAAAVSALQKIFEENKS